MKYIVANWKQNKSIQEALDWLAMYADNAPSLDDDVQVVIAAPFVLLPPMRRFIDAHIIGISLAAQDISAYDDGAFTGEVGATQLHDFVDAVIIGHSERRMYFGDTNASVAEKVAHASSAGLHSFVCIADQIRENGSVPEKAIQVEDDWFTRQIESVFSNISNDLKEMVTLVYEPISAISTFGGKPLTGDEAVEAINRIKSLTHHDQLVMYGGSVNPENIMTYWPLENVSGVMLGGASLDVEEFMGMLRQLT